METASIVFEHNFDTILLEEFAALRTLRLKQLEKMLASLHATAGELARRALIDSPEEAHAEDLKNVIEEQIQTLRGRLKQPDVIYADEISFYADLLQN